MPDPPDSGHGQSGKSSKPRQTQIERIVISLDRLRDEYTRDHEEQSAREKHKSRRETITAYLIGVYTVITAVIMVVAMSQAVISRSSEHRQLRAYVGPVINSFKLTTRPVDCDPSVSLVRIWPRPRVCFHTKNYGLTPAISPRECGGAIIFANDPNLATAIKNVIMTCRQNYGTPLATNWPQEERNGGTIPDRRVIDEISTSASHTGTLFFMIKYQDIFGDPHTTWYVEPLFTSKAQGTSSRVAWLKCQRTIRNRSKHPMVRRSSGRMRRSPWLTSMGAHWYGRYG